MQPGFEELFNKYLNNTLTKDEMLVFQRLLASDDQKESLRMLIDTEISTNSQEYRYEDQHWFAELETNVLTNIRNTRTKTRYMNWGWRKTVAAAALVVLSVGAAIWILVRLDAERSIIKPGRQIALLRLATGQET